MRKKVLVLGASGDIGTAIVKRFVEDGWHVYAHYHENEERILSLIEELGKQDDIIPVQADLRSAGSVDLLIGKLTDIQSVIHAAGKGYEGLLEDTTDEIIDELWATHVFQPVRIIRALLPAMRRQKDSSVIFLSSIWGETGASYEVMYSAVKGAQISFVKALGKELAPTGIRVNAIAAGAVETSMTAHYDEIDIKAIEHDIPYGRLAKPEEIAGAAAFLAGKDAGYITSHVLSVNGGWYA